MTPPIRFEPSWRQFDAALVGDVLYVHEESAFWLRRPEYREQVAREFRIVRTSCALLFEHEFTLEEFMAALLRGE